MNQRVCDAAECTFSQTGICMQSYANPEECPSRQAALAKLSEEEAHVDESAAIGHDELTADDPSSSIGGEAALVAPEGNIPLPRSGALGLRETDELMSRRYVNLIGIMGLPDAGKTACIASLYLLLAHAKLDGFSFANSQTLMALDEIARGARRWNDGSPPDQMTVHTKLADFRQAGFLHFRLRRDTDGRRFDLVLPDLPGEWSQALISNGDADKLRFLNAAEVLWLMADGREFVEARTRQLAIHKMTSLIERLGAVLPTPRPQTILVASWRDKGDFPAAALERIQKYGERHGFTIKLASIASFSDNDSVEPGKGLAELVAMTLAAPGNRLDPWPAGERADSTRAFLNFGAIR